MITQPRGWVSNQLCLSLWCLLGHTFQKLCQPHQGRWRSWKPTKEGRGMKAHLASMGEEVGWREEPDATVISGQMKPDPSSAWFDLELGNRWVQAARGSEGGWAGNWVLAATAPVLKAWGWGLLWEPSSSVYLLTYKTLDRDSWVRLRVYRAQRFRGQQTQGDPGQIQRDKADVSRCVTNNVAGCPKRSPRR